MESWLLELVKVSGPVTAVALASLYFGYRVALKLLNGLTDAVHDNTSAVRELTGTLKEKE